MNLQKSQKLTIGSFNLTPFLQGMLQIHLQERDAVSGARKAAVVLLQKITQTLFTKILKS